MCEKDPPQHRDELDHQVGGERSVCTLWLLLPFLPGSPLGGPGAVCKGGRRGGRGDELILADVKSLLVIGPVHLVGGVFFCEQKCECVMFGLRQVSPITFMDSIHTGHLHVCVCRV